MKIKRSILAGVLLAAMLVFTGCEKPENSARDAIAAAKGAIESAQAQYKELCTAEPTTSPCVLINRAVGAQNLAVDALNQYCTGPEWASGGVCTPHPNAKAHLDAVLADMDQIIGDLNRLLQR